MDSAPPGRCSACFFTTDFPGVTLEADGRCSVCHQSRIGEELAAHLTSGLEDLRRQAARWRAQRKGRYDCMIEDGLINGTWRKAAGLTVQGVIACNLVHAGVRTRAELEPTVAGYDAGIPAATREVEERLGIR